MSAPDLELCPGDAIYARRAGNKRFAWYVISEQLASVTGHLCAHAHRQHGAGTDAFMVFIELRKIDHGRYA